MSKHILVAVLLTFVIGIGSSTGAASSRRASVPATYKLDWTLGVPGGGPGELAHPRGIAASPFGDRLYVADTFNNRIEVFDSSGLFVRQWSVPHPVSISVNRAGHVYYVEDKGTAGRVVRANLQGVEEAGIDVVPSPLESSFDQPKVASGGAGFVYGVGVCEVNRLSCDKEPDRLLSQWDYNFVLKHATPLPKDHGGYHDAISFGLAADGNGNYYRLDEATTDNSPFFEATVRKFTAAGVEVADSDPFRNGASSLAVDLNDGLTFVAAGGPGQPHVVALGGDLKSRLDTHIPFNLGDQLTVDCRSDVYVLNVSGSISKWVPSGWTPTDSCRRHAPANVITRIGPPSTTNVGGVAGLVVPLSCGSRRCRGTLTARTSGVSRAVIGRASFDVPARSGRDVPIRLNQRGRMLAAAPGGLAVVVSAALTSQPNQRVNPAAVVVPDPSKPLLTCRTSSVRAGVPFVVTGSVSPPSDESGRVQIAFGQGKLTDRYGFLQADWFPATRTGPGQYRRVLIAGPAGVYAVQLVDLGDSTRGASHSPICTIKVVPPPAPREVSVGDLSLQEGNAGVSKVQLQVTLSTPALGRVTADWTTRDGSATAGSDYVDAAGTLSFPPGTASAYVTLNVRGDTAVEADETFTVELSNPVGAVIGRSSGSVTILNDDTAVAPSPLPDLVVQSIDGLSPTVADPNGCIVTATITNQGGGSAGPSTTRVLVPTGISTFKVASVPTPALLAGQSFQESGILSIGCGSIAFLTATADADGGVVESNEDNNVAQGP